MIMRNILFKTLMLLILFNGIDDTMNAQEVKGKSKEKIITEINLQFANSIIAGEKLDIISVKESVNDTLKAGFIDNGIFITRFETVMDDYNESVKRLVSQKFNIVEKRITVLSENAALLVTSGNFNATLKDGRIISGKFAWTFVYSKIDGNWKVIHSHMSNPR